MPYSPNEKLSLMVEIQINGVWITITSRARRAGGLTIKHGRSDGSIQGEASRCGITIGNDDGYLTEGNPMSPWYPHIGRGTPIRVSLADILASPARRFTGEIDELDMFFPGSEACVVRIEALGTLGVVAQGADTANSPMFRSISGIAANDYIPHVYWHMEDGSDATQFASAIGTAMPMTVAGTVNMARDTGLTGSKALPEFAIGATSTGSVPSYTTTGQWVFQIAALVSAEPTTEVTIAKLYVTGSTFAKWEIAVVPSGGDGDLFVAGYDAAGTLLLGVAASVDSDTFYGQWQTISLAVYPSGGDLAGTLFFFNGLGASQGPFGSTEPGASSGVVTSIVVGGSEAFAVGHAALFTDPAFDPDADVANTSAAMYGHFGEQAHERIERLCREEGLPATVYGSSSSAMGPQRVASLLDLLLDCERADQGYLFDAVDEIAVAYRTRENLYNQTSAITIGKGALTKSLVPRWNNQQVANDWTLQRIGGSSAHASDETHVAATRRRSRQSLTVNLETDDVLLDHVSWRLAIGTAPGPRYTEGAINLRNDDGALLADDVLTLVPGDRITAAAAALPSQHPPGGFDQMVIGWAEELDSREWLLHPNLIPSPPFNEVGVYGADAANSRYDSGTSTLAASYSSSATSFSVATTGGYLWATGSGGGFAFDIEVAGIRITVTAISGSSSPQTFTVTRSVDGYDKTLSSGEKVRLWEPARYGL